MVPQWTLLPGNEKLAEIAETCVKAARTSSEILGQLQSGRDLAFYGFFDALAVFSSALILMMSSTVQFGAQPTDGEAAENLQKLLEEMRDAGNMSAHNYYKELMDCKQYLDQACEQINGALALVYATAGKDNSLEDFIHANGSFGTSPRGPSIDQEPNEQTNTADPGSADTSKLLIPNVSWDLDLPDSFRADFDFTGFTP
jgi:hypothetical protein